MKVLKESKILNLCRSLGNDESKSSEDVKVKVNRIAIPNGCHRNDISEMGK